MDASLITNDRMTTLLKRQAERQLDLQKKRNEKKSVNPEHEQYNYFTQIFQEKLKTIELLLETSGNIDQKEIAFHFDKISREIHSLQKFVADSLLFLRDYDIRICQESLQDIETKARKLEDELLPKKKFGFKKRAPKSLKQQQQNGHDEVDSLKKNPKFQASFFGFRNENSANLLLNSESVWKKDVTLQNLENCIIRLNGNPSTLHMSSLVNCVVLSGPVSTSVFAENCKNCKLVIACQQLRLHSSQCCEVYLHVTSRAIIEDCSRIQVTPYNYVYESTVEDFLKAGLDPDLNHWDDIDDFNWLVTDKHSPNWTVLEEGRKVVNWDNYNLP